MAKTNQQIIDAGNVIKNETVPLNNTAERIGTQFVDQQTFVKEEVIDKLVADFSGGDGKFAGAVETKILNRATQEIGDGIFLRKNNYVYDGLVLPTTFQTTDGYFIFWATPIQEEFELSDGKYLLYFDFEVVGSSNITSAEIFPSLLHGFQDHTFTQDHEAFYTGQSGSLKCYGEVELSTSKPSNKLSFFIASVIPSTGDHIINIKVNKAYVISLSNNELYEPIIKLIDSIDYNGCIYPLIYNSEYSKSYNNTQTIDCFGDSHVGGGYDANTHSMPYYLSQFIGNRYKVNNYGNGGETILDIAARNGALPALIQPFNYVQGGDPVTANLKSYNGNNLSNRFAVLWSGLGYPKIKGVECAILSDGLGNFRVQTKDGSSLTTDRPELLVSEFMQSYNSDNVMVVCAGANGGWTSLEDLCQISRLLRRNNIKHIICSIPSNSFSPLTTREDYNNRMYELIGSNYLNSHNYVMNYGLQDNGLTPTQSDIDAISAGSTPPQLMFDTIHYNNYGLYSFAKSVYNHGVILNYW